MVLLNDRDDILNIAAPTTDNEEITQDAERGNGLISLDDKSKGHRPVGSSIPRAATAMVVPRRGETGSRLCFEGGRVKRKTISAIMAWTHRMLKKKPGEDQARRH